MVQTELGLLTFSVDSKVVVDLNLSQLILALSIFIINADSLIRLEADWTGLEVLRLNSESSQVADNLETNWGVVVGLHFGKIEDRLR